MSSGTRYPLTTIPEIVGSEGMVSDGDWVETRDQDPNGTVRLTQLADIGVGEFKHRSDRWLNKEQADRLNVTYLEPGDVLIARMPDPLGRTCVFPGLSSPAITAVDVSIVRAPNHNSRWIALALNAPQTRRAVMSFQSGSTRKRISKKNLCRIPIPIPDRAEQDRVVAVADSLLSRLASAETSLTRVKASLDRARKSVLKAAVEGRLVPTEAELAQAEGRTYEPASKLLERILEERKQRHEAEQTGAKRKKEYKEPEPPDPAGLFDLPEGWVWTTMDAVTDVSGGVTKNQKRDQAELQVPYLRVANVYANDLRLDDVSEIGVSAGERERTLLRPGDLLVVEGNGSVEQIGRVALWTGAIDPCVHQNHIIKARPTASVQQQWLLYWLLSPQGRQVITKTASSTSGLYTLNLTKVRRLSVPLPPLEEQERIVQEIERQMSVLDAVSEIIEANLSRCDRLRQGILHRAFEGRLVATHGPQEAPDPRPEPVLATD